MVTEKAISMVMLTVIAKEILMAIEKATTTAMLRGARKVLDSV